MQGIVFTYRKKKQHGFNHAGDRKNQFKAFVRRWGSVALFAVMLVLGLFVGCLSSGGLSSDTLKSLDFLFTTNMPQRLSGGVLNAFCAGFASNFLFLLAAFLMGLSLWGAAALPLISFFKGFGVGVSAGYLLMTYGFKGIMFYIAVLLPGIVMFSLALIYELSAALKINIRVFMTLLGNIRRGFKEPFALYLKSSLKYLIITFAAAAVDSALWFILSGLFF